MKCKGNDIDNTCWHFYNEIIAAEWILRRVISVARMSNEDTMSLFLCYWNADCIKYIRWTDKMYLRTFNRFPAIAHACLKKDNNCLSVCSMICVSKDWLVLWAVRTYTSLFTIFLFCFIHIFHWCCMLCSRWMPVWPCIPFLWFFFYNFAPVMLTSNAQREKWKRTQFAYQALVAAWAC